MAPPATAIHGVTAEHFDIEFRDPVLRVAVYFTGVPARLRAGMSDTFAIRYTNASENRYQPGRPFLFIDPMLSDLDAGNLTLEWQHPRTKAWSVVPWVETETAHPRSSPNNTPSRGVHNRRPRSACGLPWPRASPAGEILLRASGYVPVDRGFGLNYSQTYVIVTR